MHNFLTPPRDLPLAYGLLSGDAEAYGKSRQRELSKLKFSAGVIAFNWCAACCKVFGSSEAVLDTGFISPAVLPPGASQPVSLASYIIMSFSRPKGEAAWFPRASDAKSLRCGGNTVWSNYFNSANAGHSKLNI